MALCSRCQQRLATRQITNLGGQVVRLCDQCTSVTGDFAGFQLVPYSTLVPVLNEALARSATACPGCGSTLQRLAQSSHLGCGECYRHFRESLVATVRRLQGAACHVGRRPKRALPAPVQDLRDQLERAIAEQRYEDAAGLRDRLKELDES